MSKSSPMLFIETAGQGSECLDTLAVLVSQLAHAGVDAAIPVKSIDFHSASRYAQYDLALLLSEASPGPEDRLVLIDAHLLNDAKLVSLRRYGREHALRCVAVGRFETKQSEIGTRAKLSYVLGEDPEIFSTFSTSGTGLPANVPVIGVRGKRPNRASRIIPTVLLFGPDIDDPNLKFLMASKRFRGIIVTGGKQKQAWTDKHGNAFPVYHYGEILPAHISSMVDIFASFQGTSSSYRIQSLHANLLAEGAVMIDCSEGLEHAVVDPFFIRGPRDAIGLQSHLTLDVIPNLDALREETCKQTASKVASYARVIGRLTGLAHAAPAQPAHRAAPTGPGRAVMVPTNGVGLGHAQRTSLIAAHLKRNLVEPVFAAFPSCIEMINSHGFDAMALVSRTEYHANAHANDMLNYLRVHALARKAKALVFDGGYVFDSIYRTIHDHGLNGVWVRRGMWQAGQNNSTSLDREKVFGRVIVPAEALEELNRSYSNGDHIREVGPIVQTTQLEASEREELRASLADRFGKSFRKLVVTMLGGGVAAKRTAQIQAICGMMEARTDVLHLLVVWPTATVEPATFAWSNTRVVKTHHASPLVAASDLNISAVGYNSFHEVLYNRVPTIFMPQMSAFMDDQRARAMAAVERGLAAMVEAERVLALRNEVAAFLDGGKSQDIREKLLAFTLPEPGNRAAAAVIEEMVQ